MQKRTKRSKNKSQGYNIHTKDYIIIFGKVALLVVLAKA